MGFQTAAEHNLTRLYHYQPFHEAHLRSLLVGQRLYFSDPRTFNDPWDCQPFFRVDHLSDPKERERLIAQYKYVTRKHGPLLPDEEIERRADHFRRHPEDLVAKVMAFSEAMARGIGEQYRIYCLTPHPDHELMWAHYARSHTGVCLEFDAAHPMISVAQAVRYSRDYPAFDMVASEDPAEDIAPLVSKSAAWAYEDEYRLVSQERAHAGVGETIVTDNGDCALPAGALKAIILGCLADEVTRAAVRSLVAEGGRGVIVKQIERARDKYQLIVVE